MFLYESTKILDGDLSPLLDLPDLIDVRLMNRRHYNPPVPTSRGWWSRERPS